MDQILKIDFVGFGTKFSNNLQPKIGFVAELAYLVNLCKIVLEFCIFTLTKRTKKLEFVGRCSIAKGPEFKTQWRMIIYFQICVSFQLFGKINDTC